MILHKRADILLRPDSFNIRLLNTMTNTYNVQGMTCGGCANGVHKLLSKLEGVNGVGVDLQKQEAIIDSKHRIHILILQDALAGTHYRITEQTTVPILAD